MTTIRRLGALAALILLPALVIVGAPSATALEVPVGQVANSSTSSTSVRAYDNRYDSTRFRAGNCSGTYKNVYPGYNSGFAWDADCVRMYSGSYRVTGIIEIKNRATGSIVASTNVGCSTNRVDAAIHGGETAIVKYARRCA